MSGIGFDLDELDAISARKACPYVDTGTGKPDYVHCCDETGNPDPEWPHGGRCGDHWRNTNSNTHCMRCHLTFGTNRAWDIHNGYRKTPCMTVAELTEAGWLRSPGEIAEGRPLADIWRMPDSGDDSSEEDE